MASNEFKTSGFFNHNLRNLPTLLTMSTHILYTKRRILIVQNLKWRYNLKHCTLPHLHCDYMMYEVIQSVSGSVGHLKISWTMTAEVEIDKISRDHLMRIHVQYFMICCFTFIVNSWGRAGTAIAYPNQPFLRRLTWLERFTSTQWTSFPQYLETVLWSLDTFHGRSQ